MIGRPARSRSATGVSEPLVDGHPGPSLEPRAHAQVALAVLLHLLQSVLCYTPLQQSLDKQPAARGRSRLHLRLPLRRRQLAKRHRHAVAGQEAAWHMSREGHPPVCCSQPLQPCTQCQPDCTQRAAVSSLASVPSANPGPHLRFTPSLLMTTVRMQPPLLPSRAMAWLTAFTTNAWHSSSVMLGCGRRGWGSGRPST